MSETENTQALFLVPKRTGFCNEVHTTFKPKSFLRTLEFLHAYFPSTKPPNNSRCTSWQTGIITLDTNEEINTDPLSCALQERIVVVIVILLCTKEHCVVQTREADGKSGTHTEK